MARNTHSGENDMNKPNAHRAALTYMAAFISWFHTDTCEDSTNGEHRYYKHHGIARCLHCGVTTSYKRAGLEDTPAKPARAVRNALKARTSDRARVGVKVSEKVLPGGLSHYIGHAVRPRGPWGSGQGVMVLHSVQLRLDGSVELTGHDTRGHRFERSYPAGINRVGFRVFTVEAC